MKPKILLIGKNGQIGSELVTLLPQLGELFAFNRQQLDLARLHEIRTTIHEVRPALIINAAAYTAVDSAENDEITARLINAEALAVMAAEAKRVGAGLVHYSTDYVFNGSKDAPYDETDSPRPVNVYGNTKLAGEVAIRNSGVPHIILRTAWVYSTRGKNFLLTILRLATQREELTVVRDQVGAPTWSYEIAQSTIRILRRIAEEQDALDLSAFSGTYHATAAGVTTWYDFAKAILTEASNVSEPDPWFVSATGGSKMRTTRVIPITTDQYPTPARRPLYSVLSNSLLKTRFGVELRDWRDQLHTAFRHRATSP